MKDVQIVFIHRRKFQERPPVISVIEHLLSLGFHPTIITGGINDFYKEKLSKRGIHFYVVPFEIKGSFLKNVINGYIWGRKVRKLINRLAAKDELILWIEGNYTFDSLTPSFINKYPHILQHQEIPDPSFFKERLRMRTLGKIMPTALANLAPEYNRACMYRAFFQLKEPLYLLPNKPAFIPSKEDLISFKDKYSNIIQQIGGRKIILYQGILSGERSLESFVRAASHLDNKEYVTILMGKATKELENYKQIDSNLIHVNYIPAPEYLLITSLAYIGILAYAPNHLDLIYCAPNKIFEYSAFGVPMIGNDIPGLKYTIQDCGFGCICNMDSESDILSKLQQIIRNYDTMSKNAYQYYNSVDNKETVRQVLENVKTILKCNIGDQ